VPLKESPLWSQGVTRKKKAGAEPVGGGTPSCNVGQITKWKTFS